MPREPEDTFDDTDDLDLMSDMEDVIIWDDESKPSKRGKRGMPDDEEHGEFPKMIIYAIVVLIIVIPGAIMLSGAGVFGDRASYSNVAQESSDLYTACIQKGENHGVIAAAYHDAALINFSRGQYDLAIDQMTLAANYSLQSMGDYQAAVRDMPRDFQGANLSSEGALYMHEAEMRYIEAFKSYRSGDVENASVYWDEAKYYIGLSADHQVNHYYKK